MSTHIIWTYPWSAIEQKTVLALQQYRLQGAWPEEDRSGLAAWEKVRRTVADPPYTPPPEPRAVGRGLTAGQHDEWARNWWYRFSDAEMYADLPYRLPETVQLIPQLSFLSPEQQQQAAREWEQLGQTGERGLHWLSTRIANDIQRNPKQAGAKETLRRLIDAERRIWWANRPDYGLPLPGIDYARRVLNEHRPPWDMNAQ